MEDLEIYREELCPLKHVSQVGIQISKDCFKVGFTDGNKLSPILRLNLARQLQDIDHLLCGIPDASKASSKSTGLVGLTAVRRGNLSI